MLHAIGAHLIHREVGPGFVGVDGLVLGPVVAKDTRNLGDAPNRPQVDEEDHQPQQPLEDGIDHSVVTQEVGHELAQQRGQQEEERHAKEKAAGNGCPRHGTGEFNLFPALLL